MNSSTLVVAVAVALVVAVVVVVADESVSIVDVARNNKQNVDVDVSTDDKSTKYTPVVLLHGLMATAEAMSHAQKWIEEDFPGIVTVNVEIGSGAKLDSLFIDMNTQAALFAAAVRNDTRLANGFDVIGHSQGGRTVMTYLTRYNDPPVRHLISWAGPLDGVFGVPDWNALCPDVDCHFLADIVSRLFDNPTFGFELQQKLSFAAYWKANNVYDEYVANNRYLADVNNERTINETYRANVRAAKKILLVYSTTDTIVVPRQSPWFSFYAPNTYAPVLPFNASRQYTENLLGLRDLADAQRLLLRTVPCAHQDIPRDSCREWYDKWTKPLLGV